MNFNYIRPSRLDAALGASEQQSETYIKYDERAAQLVTMCSAKTVAESPAPLAGRPLWRGGRNEK